MLCIGNTYPLNEPSDQLPLFDPSAAVLGKWLPTRPGNRFQRSSATRFLHRNVNVLAGFSTEKFNSIEYYSGGCLGSRRMPGEPRGSERGGSP